MSSTDHPSEKGNRHEIEMRIINAPQILLLPETRGDLDRIKILSSVHSTLLRNQTRTTTTSLRHAFKIMPQLNITDLKRFPGLLDELWQFNDSRDVPDVESLTNEAVVEFRVCKKSRPARLSEIDAGNFEELVKDVHRRLGVGLNAIRTTAVQIAPDKTGTATLFPHWKKCSVLLENIGQYISRNHEQHPALCAAVAYVGIIHAHPFTDGNGRTARVIYNAILRAAGSELFLPIKALGWLSRGSLIIKLRRAYLGGEWEGILDFMLDGSKLADYLQDHRG